MTADFDMSLSFKRPLYGKDCEFRRMTTDNMNKIWVHRNVPKLQCKYHNYTRVYFWNVIVLGKKTTSVCGFCCCCFVVVFFSCGFNLQSGRILALLSYSLTLVTR